MRAEEYVKTFNVDGKEIELGLDSYCHRYFIEWVDENGEKRTTGLGAYDFPHYMEDIYYLFDSRYKELCKIDLFRDPTDEEKRQWDRYLAIFEEEYKKTK